MRKQIHDILVVITAYSLLVSWCAAYTDDGNTQARVKSYDDGERVGELISPLSAAQINQLLQSRSMVTILIGSGTNACQAFGFLEARHDIASSNTVKLKHNHHLLHELHDGTLAGLEIPYIESNLQRKLWRKGRKTDDVRQAEREKMLLQLDAFGDESFIAQVCLLPFVSTFVFASVFTLVFASVLVVFLVFAFVTYCISWSLTS